LSSGIIVAQQKTKKQKSSVGEMLNVTKTMWCRGRESVTSRHLLMALATPPRPPPRTPAFDSLFIYNYDGVSIQPSSNLLYQKSLKKSSEIKWPPAEAGGHDPPRGGVLRLTAEQQKEKISHIFLFRAPKKFSK